MWFRDHRTIVGAASPSITPSRSASISYSTTPGSGVPRRPGFSVPGGNDGRAWFDVWPPSLFTSTAASASLAPTGTPSGYSSAQGTKASRPCPGTLASVPGQGLEAFVPWAELYPDGVPVGARLALAAVLVNSDGGHTSNQALPSFPPGTENPGRRGTPLPGVVLYEIDADRDGVIDGDAAPTIVR